jgi:hypothetical protein
LGVDDNGLRCESTHPKFWSGARCNKGVVGKGLLKIYDQHIVLKILGKYYYEASVETDGLCRVGWATSEASLNLGMQICLCFREKNCTESGAYCAHRNVRRKYANYERTF